ncbi:histidine kinase dimerization/phospho-acceptor domain-containing protein [Thermosulfurimonas marina]|uniref:histidine kinase dimerization/phospho-acceptor domain-containing protein n=1 Tax=Thermosulfurimonas marina TaxID=2047767 RepID=UPI001B300AB9
MEEFHQRWLAVLAHELRTPLATIAGFTEFLLEELPGPLNSRQREKLLHIQKARDSSWKY